jgi:hypothetical protein
MKKWHKEPLIHFLFVGALIFGLFSLVNDEQGFEKGNKIEVTASDSVGNEPESRGPQQRDR